MTAKQIGAKTTISQPGTYTLARDIEQGGGTFLSEPCIRIESSDVVLDGAGHTLGGRGVSDTTGVHVSSPTELENIRITNMTIADWDRGLYLSNVTNTVVHNVHAVGNGYGMSFENISNVLLSANRISGNVLGISLDQSSHIVQVFNRIESNHGRDVFRRTSCNE